jgi:hypothetical protein
MPDPVREPTDHGRGLRRCHYCKLPIPEAERAVRAQTGNAWAHFECWYDGQVFDRDPVTGEPRS